MKKLNVKLIRKEADDFCDQCQDRRAWVYFVADYRNESMEGIGTNYICEACFKRLRKKSTVGPSGTTLYTDDGTIYSNFEFYVAKDKSASNIAAKLHVSY